MPPKKAAVPYVPHVGERCKRPGGFPPFVTPENIYTAHHPRNPKLMDAMFYLDFVKCHNEGTLGTEEIGWPKYRKPPLSQ